MVPYRVSISVELDGVGPGSGVAMASALLTDCSFSFKFPSFFLNWSVIKLESLTFEIIWGVMKSINSVFFVLLSRVPNSQPR